VGYFRSPGFSHDVKNMLNRGKVLSVKGTTARVELKLTSCERCPLHGLCQPNANKMIVEAKDTVGVNEGDTVLVEVDPKGTWLASLFLFVLPVVAFIVGFVSLYFWKGVVFAYAGGGTLFTLYVICMRYINRWFSSKKSFIPRIVKKLEGYEPQERVWFK